MVARSLILAGLVCGLRGLAAQEVCTASAPTWAYKTFPAQRDSFAVEYDDTPASAGLDVQTALSARPATAYAGLAVGVRFSVANVIDALNDGAKTYQALVALPYTAGTRYHVRLKVNVRTHRYSIWVTPPGSAEVLLGQDYGFRLGQDTVVALSYWTVYTSIATQLHTVCNFVVRPLPTAPPPGLGVALAPAVVDFGGQLVGTVSGDHSVTLTNTGADTLRFTGSSTMLNPVDFAWAGDNCGAPTGTGWLAPGGACVLRYVFQPQTVGAKVGGNDVGTSRGFAHVGLAGTATMAPPPPPPSGAVAGIRATPIAFSITAGANWPIEAVPVDSAGQLLGAPITWTSSDPTVAVVRLPYVTVTQGAVAEALKVGVATLTASAGGKVAAIGITVLPVDTAVSVMVAGFHVRNLASLSPFTFQAFPLWSGRYLVNLLGVARDTVAQASCTVVPRR